MPWLEFIRNFKRVGKLNKTHLLSEINFKVVLKVKKATKIDEIFTVDLTVTTYCQIDVEDFVIFVAFSEKVNFTVLSRLVPRLQFILH